MPAPAPHPAATATGPGRARAVRDLFAGIAPRYDLVNRLASACLDLLWRRRLARSLALSPGDWCVDVCCGTADSALAVARLGVNVVGVDSCRPMLARGAGKTPRAGTVRLAEADALALPLRAASVDAACVAFGLRNVTDPAAALREMARVVRPGGAVAVLEFSRPAAAWFRRLAALHVRHVLPALGDLVSGRHGTYRYLPDTIATWPAPEEIAALMSSCGLVAPSCRPFTGGVVTLHVATVPPPATARGA